MMDPILDEFEELVARRAAVRAVDPVRRDADRRVGRRRRHASRATGARSFVRPSASRTASARSPTAGRPSARTPVVPRGRARAHARRRSPPRRREGRRPSHALPDVAAGPATSRVRTPKSMLTALGQLWASGVAVDWEGFHRTERRRRVSLPTYPFERRSYWIGARPGTAAATTHETARHLRLVLPAGLARGRRAAGRRRGLARRTPQSSSSTKADGPRRRGRRPPPARGARPFVVRTRRSRSSAHGDDALRRRPGRARARSGSWPPRSAPTEPRLAGVVDCWSAAPPGATDLDDGRASSAPRADAARARAQQPADGASAADAARRARHGPRRRRRRRSTRRGRSASGPAKVLPQEHPGTPRRPRRRRRRPERRRPPARRARGRRARTRGRAARRAPLRRDATSRCRFAPATRPSACPSSPVVMVTGGLGHMGMDLAEWHVRPGSARASSWSAARRCPIPSEWAARGARIRVADRVARTLLRRLARDARRARRRARAQRRPERRGAGPRRGRRGDRALRPHRPRRARRGAHRCRRRSARSPTRARTSSRRSSRPKLRGLCPLIDALRGREPQPLGAPLVDLDRARRARPRRVRRRERGARRARRRRRRAVAQHRLGRVGQRRRGAERRACRSRSSRRKDRRRSCGCSARRVGSRVLVVVGDLEGGSRPGSGIEAAPAKGTGVDRHPRPNLATPFVEPRTETETRAGRDLGRAARRRDGRHPRSLLRSRRPLAARGAGGVGDPRPLPDRDAGAQAVPGADGRGARRARRPGAVARGQADDGAGARVPAVADAAPTPTRCSTARRPSAAAKASYREFYDDVTRRLERSGVGEASFFLNYGYVSLGDGDEARVRGARRRLQPQLDPARVRARSVPPTCAAGACSTSAAGAAARSRCSPSGSAPMPPASTCRRRPSRSAGACTGIRTCGSRWATPSICRSTTASFDVGHQHRVVAHLSEPARLPRRGPPVLADRRVVPLHRPAAGAALDGSARAARPARLHDPAGPRDHAERAGLVRRGRGDARGGVRRARASDRQLPRRPGIGGLRADASGAWEYRILRAERR